MKKTFLLISILIIASTVCFAKEANVYLSSKIKETELSYNLYRKIESQYTLIENGDVYQVNDINPLTTNTMITDFTIRVNSNLNEDKNVSVTITPSTFKTTLNGDQAFDSGVKPIINTIIDKKIVYAGLNSDKEVYRFNIFIGGKPNLPAGIYVSNVDVEYIIE
ncbi:MAG: hypothetical protein EOL97_16625 [Spirochaetia bacterium]|nr:hypothetical protein [Spirochaetia bacterium]